MKKASAGFHRIPAADWQTEDLHRLWADEPSESLQPLTVSAHGFLDYCYVLRTLREWFHAEDSAQSFDKVFFFLRGGYFAFAYLNRDAQLLERAAIFGGLGHARDPERKLEADLDTKTACENEAQKLRRLVIDEVKSGSGMGRILKAFSRVLLAAPVRTSEQFER